MMQTLYDDLFVRITNELSDKQKIYISMLSKRFDRLKLKFIYTELISLSKIKQLPYFDNFENVTHDIVTNYHPKYVKFVHFLAYGTNIPYKVTHLTFCAEFDQPLNNCVPYSVTRLTFGYFFNQLINDCIPSSVTHLTFGYFFNQLINDCIPSSVTHLNVSHHLLLI
jgi:hypothetical protein